MPVERKLAAIMFTDIVGYTALSAKDETKALNLLDTQKKILTPIIEEFNGTLHKEMGDGLLFTFPTVSEAVKCGIKIQEQTKESNDLDLRIGIHEGEVTLKDGDVLGDDVNVASRIEPFSAVGGIAISGKVQQNILSLTEFETKYIGKPKLKGVSQKVEVYCITSHGLPQTDVSKVSAKLEVEEVKPQFNIYALTGGILTAIGVAFWIAVGVFDVSFALNNEVPSIGILMMDNIGEEDDEFWARGITEDLIVKIAGSGLIRVAPMKEILEVDVKQSFREIAKKLRVKYLLTTSLHKKTEGFDLRSQLIEVDSGNSKYANKWSEPFENAPMIVGKLASDLLRTLKVSTNQEITNVQTSSAEAYKFYLKGKYIFFTRTNKDDLHNSRELLIKSIELDKNLLSAELALGYTYFDQWETDKAFEIFSSCLKKSHEIGNMRYIANSLKAVGEIHWGNDNEKAMPYFNDALEIFLKINDKNGIGDIYRDIGNLTAMSGELDNALILYDKSLDAFSTLGDNTIDAERTLNNIGNVSLGKGDYTKAKASLEASTVLNILHNNKNGLIRNYRNLTRMYKNLEDYENALKYSNLVNNIILALDVAPKIQANHLYFIGTIYYAMNLFDDALEYFNQAEILYYNEEISFEKYQTTHFRLSISKIICEIKLNKIDVTEKIILINDIVKSIVMKHERRYDYWQLYEFYSLLEDGKNAEHFLEMSYNQIIEESKKLNSDSSRKLYLYKNTYNRKIVEEYEKVFKK